MPSQIVFTNRHAQIMGAGAPRLLNRWAGTKIVEMVGGTKIVEKVGGHKQLSSLRCKKEIETKFKKINYTLIFFCIISVYKNSR